MEKASAMHISVDASSRLRRLTSFSWLFAARLPLPPAPPPPCAAISWRCTCRRVRLWHLGVACHCRTHSLCSLAVGVETKRWNAASQTSRPAARAAVAGKWVSTLQTVWRWASTRSCGAAFCHRASGKVSPVACGTCLQPLSWAEHHHRPQGLVQACGVAKSTNE